MLRGVIKVKIRADGLSVRDLRRQDGEENQAEELGTPKCKKSYRDSLMGEANPHTLNQEIED